MVHKKISYHIYMETKPHMYKQDRYDYDDNDMHEGLLDPINFSPFGNIKKKRRGMSR